MARASFIPSDVGLVELGVGRARLAIPVVNLIGGIWMLGESQAMTTRSGPSRYAIRDFADLAHEKRQSPTKVLLHLGHVVRPAAQLQVLDDRRSAVRVRLHVMEFEEPSLGASSHSPDERALAGVTLPDCPPDGCRNVTRGCSPPGAPHAAGPSPQAWRALNRSAAASAHDRRSRQDRRSESSAAGDPGHGATCHVCRATR